MIKKSLSKITTNMKTLSNESMLNESFVSEKLNINFDKNVFEKIDSKNKLAKSEIKDLSPRINPDLKENLIITKYNEYSIFNSLEENQLKQNNNDKQIYNYLIKN